MSENIPITRNFLLAVMLNTNATWEAEQSDLASLVRQALTDIQFMSMISKTMEANGLSILEGTYSGPLDDGNSDNDPGIYNQKHGASTDSNDITETNVLFTFSNSYGQAAQTSANGTENAVTAQLKSGNQASQQLQSFMQNSLGGLDFISQLLTMSLG